MAETIAIIDYGSGNLRSVAKAFERAAADADLTASVLVTSDPRAVAAADRIVLPGVGAFRACAEGLAAVDGMTEAISEVVMAAQRPFMGVCVGMQLMADEGLEFGATPGLGWIPGKVRALADDRPDARTPHMGWNELIGARPHPVLAPLDGEPDGVDVYFLHSFYFDAENDDQIIAVCDYNGRFPAAVARDNLVGLQFHPEKSQAAGLAMIGAFLKWTP